LNTKVIDNFIILRFLKFHDFTPDSLGVIDFIICCQVLYVLYTYLNDCIVWLI